MSDNFDPQTYRKIEEILDRMDALEKKIDKVLEALDVDMTPKGSGSGTLPRAVLNTEPNPADFKF
ncbi:MAG: hypothetical protein ACTMIK_10000 [Galactobacter sp.]